MTNSSVYFNNIDSLLRQAINMKEQINNSQGRRYVAAATSEQCLADISISCHHALIHLFSLSWHLYCYNSVHMIKAGSRPFPLSFFVKTLETQQNVQTWLHANICEIQKLIFFSKLNPRGTQECGSFSHP